MFSDKRYTNRSQAGKFPQYTHFYGVEGVFRRYIGTYV